MSGDRDKPGAPGQNTGHGHVYPRPDNARMRCGGPGLCQLCAKDAAGLAERRVRQQVVSLDAVMGTCDWGGCDDETTAMRWSNEADGWLSVCAEHEDVTT